MPSGVIQWFPGHMAKTRRIISLNLRHVDVVIEILDARIPHSSRNPEILSLIGQKPSLVLLNKSSLADPRQTDAWQKKYTRENNECINTDCITGLGLSKISPAIMRLCADKLERNEARGLSLKPKAMVLGIPNVGKSSLINKLCKNKKARVEDRPGVTLDKQWVSTSYGIDLLDMPGILWPKFDDQKVGENLAITGAIRDSILDNEEIAVALIKKLRKHYPELLFERYGIGDISDYTDCTDYDLLVAVGRKRGHLIKGGEVETGRTADMLIDELRGGRIGRITLDFIEKF